MKTIVGAAGLLILLLVSGDALGTVWYVDIDNVSGSHDGTSWEAAYQTIQQGVNVAFSAGGGEVWVAEGTYTATSSPVVQMRTNVAIYGGFAGTESLRSERDLAAHVSAIDGQNARRCVEGASNATLDAFTVKRGSAGWLNSGSGMYNSGAWPTVTCCRFEANRTSALFGGAAIANVETSLPHITNCVFVANSGGAIYDAMGCSSTIVNCSFTGNTNDAAVYTFSNATKLTNCVLWGDASEIEPAAGVQPSVTYCDIRGGYTGEGNLSADPLYVDAANGDLRLGTGSPCVNAGSNTGIPAVDILGLPRPRGSRADMGAYEEQECLEPSVLNTNAAADSGDDNAPSIATDDNGHWVVVWASADSLGGTIGTDSDILVARSSNNGLSWSDPEALNVDAASDSKNDSNPHVVYAGTGHWVVSWSSAIDVTGGTDVHSKAVVARSTNNGQNWSAAVVVSPYNIEDTGPEVYEAGGKCLVAFTRYVFAGHYAGRDYYQQSILCSQSADFGATWSSLHSVHDNPAAPLGSVEMSYAPRLAGSASSHWVAVWYAYPAASIQAASSSNDGVTWGTSTTVTSLGSTYLDIATDGLGNWVAVWPFMASRSTNNGTSWSAPVEILAATAATSVTIEADGRGFWRSIWGIAGGFGGVFGSDTDLFVTESMDYGATWSAPAPLNSNADCDTGADFSPALAFDNEGRSVTAWVSSDTLGGTIGTDYDILVASSEAGTGDILANEAAAREAMCMVIEAERAFYRDHGEYSVIFDLLTDADPPYLTGDWAYDRDGYYFTLGGTTDRYHLNADPVYWGVTGCEFFYTDSTEVVRYTLAGAADETCDPYPEAPCAPSVGIAANEALVVEDVCTINQAQQTYYAVFGYYAGTWDELEWPSYLFCHWVGPRHGYAFTLSGGGAGYTLTADPDTFGITGNRGFYSDESGIVRGNNGAAAGPSSDPVAEACVPDGPCIGNATVNDAGVQEDLCLLFNAEAAYFRDNGVYALAFEEMTSHVPPYLAGDWQVRDGHTFLLGGTRQAYECNVDPCTPGTSSDRYFFLDATGIVRASIDGAADASSPSISKACGAAENVWYVDADNTSGNENGLTWVTAFNTIQEGVDAASAGGGGQVWVAEGTYTSSTTPVVTMAAGVDLYGGFAGTESSVSERDLASRTAIIDGRRVVTRGVAGANNAVLDGFTITRCPGPGFLGTGGGGMDNNGVSPVVRNCRFFDNGSSWCYGGGISNRGGAATLMVNCVFVGNAGYFGGGVYTASGSASTLVNCTFTLNTGRAINTLGTASIANCIMWGDPDGEFGNSGTTTISHSDVQGGFAGTGNIDADPRFVDAASGDVRLRQCSPCIDTAGAYGAPDSDLDGAIRPQGNGYDMGAYEVSPWSGGIPCGIWCVDVDNTSGNEDGRTWETAFNTIQEGIEAAYASGGGEVWVAEGEYNAATYPIVTMRPGVHLYGGFAGTEVSRDERDWALHIVDIDGSYASRCVVAADASTLDGFTVSHASRAYMADSCGAGMIVDSGSPRIVHCQFEHCYVVNEDASHAPSGAAVYVGGGSPVFEDCVFYSNTTAGIDAQGGAVHVAEGSAVFRGCTFSHNTVTGAGPSALPWSVPGRGGAIADSGDGTVIEGCEFANNSATGSRGADGTTSTNGVPGGPAYGGAVRVSDPSASVRNCLFHDNEAFGGQGGGGNWHMTNGRGGNAYGGGLCVLGGTQEVVNCVFVRNHAHGGKAGYAGYEVPYYPGGDGYGGAIGVYTGSPRIVNCSIWDGRAYGGDYDGHGYGGGIGYLDAAPVVTNCIVWAWVPNAIAGSGSATPAVTYSDVYGVAGGTGNLNIDPLFTDPAQLDLALTGNSPCIDAGTANGAALEDILGTPRPLYSGFDIGAYEYFGPRVISGPASQTVCRGARVTFAIQISSPDAIAYQWIKDGQDIAGATDAAYIIDAAAVSDQGAYACSVAAESGTVLSGSAQLTVGDPPLVTIQPKSQTVNAGKSVYLWLNASGTAPLSYRWKKNGVNIPGATSLCHGIPSAQAADQGVYTCVVDNLFGSMTSEAATLAVNVPPAITAQPRSQTVTAGKSVYIWINAAGTAPLSYQWTLNDTNIPGATSACHGIPSAQPANAGTYRCVVKNSAGSATSNPATLVVNVPPTITVQPKSQTVSAGRNVYLWLNATGTAPLSYQWTVNDTNIPGATSACHGIPSATPEQSGAYRCRVGNVAGNALSDSATLAVTQ